MTGVKGRSGVVVDEAHHSAKRIGGRAGGLAKRDKSRQLDDGPDGDDDSDQVPAVEGARFAIKNWIDYKDHLTCELQKKKIAAADIEVETLTIKRDLERGALLTRDQVRARDESHNAAIKERLATVNELLAKYVPADKLLAAQTGAQKWIDDFLEHVANAIEGGK